MLHLQVENVTTMIGNEKLISDVSFTVSKGEMVALVGHNGAGKSTLLKTIMNMQEKYAGEIIIAGKYSIDKHLLSYKKRLSYLPEEPLLLPELTVMQHFQLYAMSYGLTEKESDLRIKRYVENFDLMEKLDMYPEELSKGMRQKTQAICALLPEVNVLLIDEPFIGLDVYAKEFMIDVMKEKLQEGTSIILTTHQLDVLAELANRFVLLENGRVVKQGSIDEFDSITRGH